MKKRIDVLLVEQGFFVNVASQIYKENGEIKKITIGGVVKLSDKLEIEL